MNHPKFTHEQLVGIPILILLELHRRASAANWPPSADKEVAEWCVGAPFQTA